MITTKQFVSDTIDTLVAESRAIPVDRDEVAITVAQMLADARAEGRVSTSEVLAEVKALMRERDNSSRSAKLDLKAWQAVLDYREGKIVLSAKHVQWLNTAMPVGVEDRGKLILVKYMNVQAVLGKIAERQQHVLDAEASLEEYRQVGTEYISVLEAAGKANAAALVPGL